MMKKWTALLLALALCGSLAACGGDKAAAEDTAEKDEVVDTVKPADADKKDEQKDDKTDADKKDDAADKQEESKAGGGQDPVRAEQLEHLFERFVRQQLDRGQALDGQRDRIQALELGQHGEQAADVDAGAPALDA